MCPSWNHTVKDSGMRIRVEPELRRQFIDLCRDHDLTAAQVLRAFMRYYVLHRGAPWQCDLFDRVPVPNIRSRRESSP